MHFTTALLSAVAVSSVVAIELNHVIPTYPGQVTTTTSEKVEPTWKPEPTWTPEPTWKPEPTKQPEPTWKPEPIPTTKTTQPTTLITTTKAAPTDSTNNGNIALNKCTSIGLSVATCTQLLNIAALNNNDINVGQGLVGGEEKAPAATSAASGNAQQTNNGNVFVNKCLNLGVSILDCTQVLNLVLLNGNDINIL